MFGDIFGGGRGRQRAARGANLRYNMDLTLEEAVRGVTKEIRIPTLEECDVCHGSGASGYPATDLSNLSWLRRYRCAGFFAVQQACPHCHGRGTLIKDPCTKCHGHGRVRKPKPCPLRSRLAWIRATASVWRVRAKQASTARPGDLYVQVQVKQHAIFEREGNNLYCEVPINFAMAALGGEIEVPTLDGRVNLKILVKPRPASCSHARQRREIRSRWCAGRPAVPRRRGNAGWPERQAETAVERASGELWRPNG